MYQPRNIPKTFQKKEAETPPALTAREHSPKNRNAFPTELLLLCCLFTNKKDG